MKKWFVTLTSSALLVLVGCGGGSDSTDSTPIVGGALLDEVPVFSILNFPVRDPYHAMMDPAKPIGLNLAGSDNAVIEPTTTTTVTQVDWPAWSKFPPPPPDVTVTTIPANLRWIGTITAQRRTVDFVVTTYQESPIATTAVDYIVNLKRLRDGAVYDDALTVFFDAEYRPLAAVTMQSRLWTWATPLRGLPVNGTIGVSSGAAIATSCEYPDVPSLNELGCSLDNTFLTEAVPVYWALQPDTAQTGFITFAYRAPFFSALDGTSSFARSEATVKIQTRIDGNGIFRGVVYERTEGPLTIRLRG